MVPLVKAGSTYIGAARTVVRANLVPAPTWGESTVHYLRQLYSRYRNQLERDPPPTLEDMAFEEALRLAILRQPRLLPRLAWRPHKLPLSFWPRVRTEARRIEREMRAAKAAQHDNDG